MLHEYLRLAWTTIRHRKLRSWLTIVGIVIGIASIISLLTLSQSLQGTVEKQFESFGEKRILISAKGFQSPGTASLSLTTDDMEALETIGGIDYFVPNLFRGAEVVYKDEISFTTIHGLPAEDLEKFYVDTDSGLSDGRFMRDGETNVAVVGSRVAIGMFGKEVRTGNKITINHQEFKVVGILEEMGNQQDDNAIMIPLETERELFNEPERIDVIIAQVHTVEDVPELQKEIEERLEESRGDTNFQVLTASQILKQIGNILGIMQIVLVGIAAISILVGTIGIMNAMYTSVLERTKDIGIMKAIGARNSDIIKLFIVEAGIIGLIGGILGTALGSGIALVVGPLSKNAGFTINVTLDPVIIFFGLFFAAGIGILAGILPAYQASRLKPVDALRYE